MKPSDGANPYAAPSAPVEDRMAATQVEPPFFSVSIAKLGVMTVATFGIFLYLWFYKNWKSVQRFSTDRPNAPLRSLFFPLMAYSLFRRIRMRSAELGVPAPFSAGWLALALFVMAMLAGLPDPLWIAALLQFVPLIPVQQAVNVLNAKIAPETSLNSRFSIWNVVAIALGGSLVVLSIVGIAMTNKR